MSTETIVDGGEPPLESGEWFDLGSAIAQVECFEGQRAFLYDDDGQEYIVPRAMLVGRSVPTPE